ncbi:MAG TPA: hypothetical protein VGB51_08225 [Actinomycetota bacterium]
MARKLVIVSAATLVAFVVAAPLAPGSAAGPDDYREAVESTMAENSAQASSNVTFAGNILCTILPFDAASISPTWHGAGAGAVDTATVRSPADTASFGATCASPSLARDFTLTVTYGFQFYSSSGVWLDVKEPTFFCSTGSSHVGTMKLAHLEVPGTPGCPFEEIYEQWQPSIVRPHRLEVELFVPGGPQISGWSIPWMLPLKPRA